MPGLIGQHLPTVFVPNPPLGSSTLLFDNTGVLSIKRNDGSVEVVGGSGSVSIDLNQISFGTSTGLTSSVNFVINGSDVYLIFGSNSISGTSSNSSIIGGRGSEITNSENSVILGGECYSGTPTFGSSGGNQIIGGCNNLVTGGFCGNYGGNTYNFPNRVYNSYSSTILGGAENILGTSSFSSIIGGRGNKVCTNSNGCSIIILGGYCNEVNGNTPSNSSIINGECNTIYGDDYNSSIIGGEGNTLSSRGSLIAASKGSQINYSQYSVILGGECFSGTPSYGSSGGNQIIGGKNNLVTGGFYCNNGGTTYNFPNRVYNSCSSTILGGSENILGTSSLSSIIGGRGNTLNCSSYSSIMGGRDNTLSCYSPYSSIIGGLCNSLSCYSDSSSIIGGYCNTLSDNSYRSSIIGGQYNTLSDNSRYSSIIGGACNTIGTQSCNSVILGGNNLTLNNQCNTALTQHLWIAGSVSPNNGSNFGQTQNVFVSGFGTFSFINGVFTGITV